MSTDNLHEQHGLEGKEWGNFHEVVSPRAQVGLGVGSS